MDSTQQFPANLGGSQLLDLLLNNAAMNNTNTSPSENSQTSLSLTSLTQSYLNLTNPNPSGSSNDAEPSTRQLLQMLDSARAQLQSKLDFEQDGFSDATSPGTSSSFHPYSKGTDTSGMKVFEEEFYTPEQLKKLTPKERRQIRNKISARNFRVRRKEYITTLESQIQHAQAETTQWKLKCETLETENKTLREQLTLLVTLATSPATSDNPVTQLQAVTSEATADPATFLQASPTQSHISTTPRSHSPASEALTNSPSSSYTGPNTPESDTANHSTEEIAFNNFLESPPLSGSQGQFLLFDTKDTQRDMFMPIAPMHPFSLVSSTHLQQQPSLAYSSSQSQSSNRSPPLDLDFSLDMDMALFGTEASAYESSQDAQTASVNINSETENTSLQSGNQNINLWVSSMVLPNNKITNALAEEERVGDEEENRHAQVPLSESNAGLVTPLQPRVPLTHEHPHTPFQLEKSDLIPKSELDPFSVWFMSLFFASVNSSSKEPAKLLSDLSLSTPLSPVFTPRRHNSDAYLDLYESDSDVSSLHSTTNDDLVHPLEPTQSVHPLDYKPSTRKSSPVSKDPATVFAPFEPVAFGVVVKLMETLLTAVVTSAANTEANQSRKHIPPTSNPAKEKKECEYCPIRAIKRYIHTSLETCCQHMKMCAQRSQLGQCPQRKLVAAA